jgi:hypothetical protein
LGGAAFAGVCHAVPDESHQPSPQRQENLCNCGYARGICERFPKDAIADAVRFSVTADEPRRLSLVYIFEKDHAPAEFGELEYSIVKQTLLSPVANQVLAIQAEAFIENYLARTRA